MAVFETLHPRAREFLRVSSCLLTCSLVRSLDSCRLLPVSLHGEPVHDWTICYGARPPLDNHLGPHDVQANRLTRKFRTPLRVFRPTRFSFPLLVILPRCAGVPSTLYLSIRNDVQARRFLRETIFGVYLFALASLFAQRQKTPRIPWYRSLLQHSEPRKKIRTKKNKKHRYIRDILLLIIFARYVYIVKAFSVINFYMFETIQERIYGRIKISLI